MAQEVPSQRNVLESALAHCAGDRSAPTNVPTVHLNFEVFA
jgi:hypothetical protein